MLIYWKDLKKECKERLKDLINDEENSYKRHHYPIADLNIQDGKIYSNARHGFTIIKFSEEDNIRFTTDFLECDSLEDTIIEYEYRGYTKLPCGYYCKKEDYQRLVDMGY